MSNDSRIAVSFAPAYFHHWRSNSRISWSRSPKRAAGSALGRAAAASIVSPLVSLGAGARRGGVYARNHSDVIRLRRVAETGWGGSIATSTTRGAILATGRIARGFATNLRAVPGAVLAAVGSRAEESAEAFARDLVDDATRTYASYDALVADPDVDVVSVASPHALHLDHARLAFAAGQPVLCEKPLALNRADGEALFDAAGDLFCMEAMWMACHPLMRDVRRRLEAGEFGTPRPAYPDLGFGVAPDAARG